MSAATVGVVTLCGTLVIAAMAAFIASAARPARPKEQVIPAVYRARFGYFMGLLVLLTAAFVLTLPKHPYGAMGAADQPDALVRVTGAMWAWRFEADSGGPVRADGTLLRVPVGRSIEFRVAAEDASHGFGIYDDRGRLLAQTQAMPGYENRLRYTFRQAGTYDVLCMEYCGMMHHNMKAQIKAE